MPFDAAPTGARSCDHCGLEVPRGRESAFCCRGCEAVFGILHASGLDRYYALRGARGLPAVTGGEIGADRKWLEAFSASRGGKGDASIDLDVQGIHCAACVWVIEELFRRRADGLAATIDLNPTLGRMRLRIPEELSLDGFADDVEHLGYRLAPAGAALPRASDDLVVRLGIAAALAGNTMTFAVATYLGLGSGALFDVLRKLSWAAALLSVLVGGSVFIRSALGGLRARVLHLDLPIAIGIVLAFGGASIRFFFGDGDVGYLDTVTVFVVLMLLGRFLQERMLERNRRRLLDGRTEALLSRVERDGAPSLVPCSSIAEGDVLLLARGDLVPVDATLLDDAASFSLDWIDGESEPRTFAAGAQVPAGAFHVGEVVARARAADTFARSPVQRLLVSPTTDPNDRGAVARWWSRVSGGYVLGVFAAAVAAWALTFARTASWLAALDVTTAVLVVTCPCAFGIAVPLAYEIAHADLRRAGLFVRRARFLDRLRHVVRVAFDKTGTLTTGELAVSEVVGTLDGDERSVLAAMVTQSHHPKSAAVGRWLAAQGVRPAQGVRVREDVGRGLEARVGGRVFRVGSAELVAARAGAEPSFGEVHYAIDGEVRASLALVEALRPEASEDVRALRARGLDVAILSGDAPARVGSVARSVGIPAGAAFGGMRPEDKAAWLAAREPERTLMMGDGLNDSLAVGETACSGTPAIDRPFLATRCDFYLVSPGLRAIVDAVDVARRLARTVQADLAIAVVYNVAVVGIALMGWMRPWLAAVLMPASSIATIAFTTVAMRTPRGGTRWTW